MVVYDGYRPQEAVNHFVDWAENSKQSHNQIMKELYYPRVDKNRTFDYGYIAKTSGHTRGSTVDLTLIKSGVSLQEVVVVKRIMADGSTLPYLDDATLDMGSSFDLFDIASYQYSPLVSKVQQANRDLLKNIMENNGFKSYDKEWWHFTLVNEPYKDKYFNFAIDPILKKR